MRTTAFAVIILSSVPAVTGQSLVPSHAGAAVSRPAPTVVARVNGVPLLSDRLDAAVNRLLPFESFHRSVKAEKVAAVRARALNDLIDEELMYQNGLRLGVRATRAEIERVLTKVRSRYPDEATFERRLRGSGGTVAQLRREIQRSVVVQKTTARVVTSRCDVGRDEARTYYVAHPDRFVLPEQLHVFAITIGVDPAAPSAAWAKARTTLEMVRSEAVRGTAFDALARTYSTDASRASGGDMGLVHRGSLNDEFEHALRTLKPGEVSPVIRSLYGFHLVRVAEIRPARTKGFAEVEADLRRNLTAQRCEQMKRDWVAKLRASATLGS